VVLKFFLVIIKILNQWNRQPGLPTTEAFEELFNIILISLENFVRYSVASPLCFLRIKRLMELSELKIKWGVIWA